MAMSSVLDERTFREIYLTGFEIAIKEGKAKSIMSSYNMINGTYANENAHLLCGVAQLVDLKVGITKDDAMMLEFLRQTELPYFIVATKTDKLNTTGRNAALESLRAHPLVGEDVPVLPFSALKGEGKDAVWGAIMELAQK